MLFRERLTVPIIWWVLAGLFALSVLLAVGAYLGPVWGVGTSVATLLIAAGNLRPASLVISVDAQETHVGRASIEHAYVADCRALDAEETRRALASRPMPELTWCFGPTSRQPSRSPSTTRTIRCRTGWSRPDTRTGWQPHCRRPPRLR